MAIPVLLTAQPPPPQARRLGNLARTVALQGYISATETAETMSAMMTSVLWSLQLSGMHHALLVFGLTIQTRSIDFTTGSTTTRSETGLELPPVPFERIVNGLVSLPIETLRTITTVTWFLLHTHNELVLPAARERLQHLLRSLGGTVDTHRSIATEHPHPRLSFAYAAYFLTGVTSFLGRIGTLSLGMHALATSGHLLTTRTGWSQGVSGTRQSLDIRTEENTHTPLAVIYAFIVTGYTCLLLRGLLGLRLRAQDVQASHRDDDAPGPTAV